MGNIWFIAIPLLLIGCIAGFYQLFTINTINYSSTQNIPINIPQGKDPYTMPRVSDVLANSDSTNIAVEMTSGILAIVVASTSVAVVAGVKLFGNGLSEHSVRTIYRATVYYGLWGVFSALSYPFFLNLPLFSGVFFWFMLTLIYSLGYFDKV